MKPFSKSKRILLIDYQPYWREIFTQTLKSVGFSVCTLETYNYSPPQDCLQGEKPDLVVLGCAHIGPEEQQLITRILGHKHHILVLCDFLPWQEMRSLFLQGVDDITDKPYDPAYLVSIVIQTLESIVPHNGYQAVERDGAA
jgi:DNA-binding response OmpR family regulator